MTRTWMAFVLVVAASWPVTAAGGQLPMREIDCSQLATLPAIKLVVRAPEVLARMGVSELIELDFTKEMGLFISMGPQKTGLEAIVVKSVTEADGKIVVETEKVGFEEMLKATNTGKFRSYHFLVVPASKLPVEGFVEDLQPCEGLCATSSLVPITEEPSFKDFRERAEARKLAAARVSAPNPMIMKLDYLDSAAWDIGPADDPKGVRIRFFALKGGGGAQASYEFLRDKYYPPKLPPPPVSREARQAWLATKPPVDKTKLVNGIAAAYKTPEANAETAADQILQGYLHKTSETEGRCDVPAIRKSDLDAESFRKFIESDGKTFVTQSGCFIDMIDEVGKCGSLRWTKPYIKAEGEVEGLGKVTVAYNEIKLFQIRIEEVKTTNVEELRDQAKKLARRLSLRLSDEAVAAMHFTFSVKR